MKEVVVVGTSQGQSPAEFQELVMTRALHNYETNRTFSVMRASICDMGVEIFYALLDTLARKDI